MNDMQTAAAAPARCTQCQALLAGGATGPLCGPCELDEIRPREGWRAYVPSEAVPGAIAAGIGLVASFSLALGRYIDVVSVLCGCFAVATGLLGAYRTRRRKTLMLGALAVIAIGLYEIVLRGGLWSWIL